MFKRNSQVLCGNLALLVSWASPGSVFDIISRMMTAWRSGYSSPWEANLLSCKINISDVRNLCTVQKILLSHKKHIYNCMCREPELFLKQRGQNSLIAARDWVSWTDDDVTRAQPQVPRAMHQLHSAATGQRHLVTANYTRLISRVKIVQRCSCL